ncbi:hypothetical protein, partial [Microcystis wesenbergii]|uniref:hypothetical protein n=2 Tax=Microcystis TaxID=1125 RepID=UPI0016808532
NCFVLNMIAPLAAKSSNNPTQPQKEIAKQYTFPPPELYSKLHFLNIYIPLRQASLATLRAIAFYLLVVNNADDKS